MTDLRPEKTAPRVALKGPAKCRHELTVRSRQAEVLGPEVDAWLFRHAEILCEGAVRSSASGPEAWFGSTMITVDLATIATRYRGVFDEAAQERLVRLLEGSVRVRLRAMRLASDEVRRRLPDRTLGTASSETRIRIVGSKLHLDVDLEVPIGVSSRGGQP